MSAHNDKQKQLVDHLVALTSRGQIDWYLQGDNTQRVHAKLKVGELIIGKSKDASGQDAVRISVFTKDGPPSLSFDDTDIVLYDEETGDRFSCFPTMQALLNDALRYAKGEDRLIDEILAELSEKDDEIPF